MNHGANILLSDLSGLAALANQKRLPGYPFEFLPECFSVSSEAAMLKLGCADRGVRPGGVAIRSDLGNAAFRLTGADYRDVSAWTAYSGRTSLSGQWRSELNRIRAAIALYYRPFTVIGWHLEDGEYFAPSISSAGVGYSQNRYGLTANPLTWPASLSNAGGSASYVPYKDLDYVTDQSGGGVTVTAYGSIREYVPADLDYTTSSFGTPSPHAECSLVFRIETPTAARLDSYHRLNDFGTSVAELRLDARIVPSTANYVPATFTLLEDGGGRATIRKETIVFNGKNFDRFYVSIGGNIPAGITEFTVKMRVEAPYYFAGYQTFLYGGTESGQMGLTFTQSSAVLTNAIHNSRDVHSIGVIPPGTRARISCKMRARSSHWRYFGVDGEPTVDWWWNENIFQALASVSGFFRSKIAMIGGVNIIDRIGSGSAAGKPKLAPYAEDAIANSDQTVRIGFVGDSDVPAQASAPGAIRPPAPRCLFRRTTDVPNQIALNVTGFPSGAITAGSTIPIITVRRGATGDPARVDDSEALQVRVGCIRNGAFTSFESFTLAAGESERTWYPDWMVYTAHSLAYEADAPVDVQAAIVPPNAASAFAAVQSGYFSLIMADFYQNTLETVQAIPDPV